jgi:hypothetical protein
VAARLAEEIVAWALLSSAISDPGHAPEAVEEVFWVQLSVLGAISAGSRPEARPEDGTAPRRATSAPKKLLTLLPCAL